MRLRLHVERNGLPTTQALWPVKDTKSTVAQLLQHINGTFPLEADTWGLEDYSVSISGYECLHYHEIGAVCKDEDGLLIKPLQYVDVRARTLTGRDQIAADGRHLVDGVPFGRPCLKGPVRPQLSIPPRKTRKLLHDGQEDGDEESPGPLMLMNGDKVADVQEEEGDDGDFEEDESEDEEASSSAVSSSSEESEESDESDISSDSDTPESDEDASADEASEDTDSWDGLPASEPSPLTHKSRSNATTNLTEPDNQPANTDTTNKAFKRKRSSDDGIGEADSDARGAKRNRDADDEDDTQPHPDTMLFDDTGAAKVEAGGKYGKGTYKTQSRNVRQRKIRQLKHLKKRGTLPADANLSTLYDWQEKQGDQAPKKAQAMQPTPKLPNEQVDGQVDGEANEEAEEKSQSKTAKKHARKKFRKIKEEAETHLNRLQGIDTGDVKKAKKSKKSKVPNDDVEDDGPPSELSSKHVSNEGVYKIPARRLRPVIGGTSTITTPEITPRPKIDLTGSKRIFSPNLLDDDVEDEEPLPELSSEGTPKDNVYKIPARRITPVIPDTTTAKTPESTPRSKLDVAASKRMLFASLGEKVPITQEEKERLQEKLAEKPKKRVINTSQPWITQGNDTNFGPAPTEDEEPSQHTEGDEEPLSWRSKKDDEEPLSWRSKIRLTAAECCDDSVTLSTPPFPFSQKWDQNGNHTGNQKWKYSKNQRKALDNKGRSKYNPRYVRAYQEYHTDGYVNGKNEEYWEPGALLHEEEQYDEEGHEFPDLPENVEELPLLSCSDAAEGDFITFNELAVDKSTGWQPQMVTRTAQILIPPSEEQQVLIQLSRYDLPARDFDEDGNRVFGKFEMPMDVDQNDGRKDVKWDELGLVRLVQRSVASETVD